MDGGELGIEFPRHFKTLLFLQGAVKRGTVFAPEGPIAPPSILKEHDS